MNCGLIIRRSFQSKILYDTIIIKYSQSSNLKAMTLLQCKLGVYQNRTIKFLCRYQIFMFNKIHKRGLIRGRIRIHIRARTGRNFQIPTCTCIHTHTLNLIGIPNGFFSVLFVFLFMARRNILRVAQKNIKKRDHKGLNELPFMYFNLIWNHFAACLIRNIEEPSTSIPSARARG